MRRRSSRRIIAPLGAALLLAVGTVVGGVGAGEASARPPMKSCAFIWRYFVDVGARGTSCRTAERVARRYMAAVAASGLHPRYPRRELGFRCRRIIVPHAAAGWYARCRKGGAVVGIVPT